MFKIIAFVVVLILCAATIVFGAVTGIRVSGICACLGAIAGSLLYYILKERDGTL